MEDDKTETENNVKKQEDETIVKEDEEMKSSDPLPPTTPGGTVDDDDDDDELLPEEPEDTPAGETPAGETPAGETETPAGDTETATGETETPRGDTEVSTTETSTETMKNLFGEDDGDDTTTTSKVDTTGETPSGSTAGGDTKKIDEEEVPVPRVKKSHMIARGLPAVTTVPLLSNHPEDTQYTQVSLPNVISIEQKSFTPESYIADSKKKSVSTKIGSDSVIRWREVIDKDGNKVKESNARLVKWSDGSGTLYLGDEIFSVISHPLDSKTKQQFIFTGCGRGVNLCLGKLDTLMKFRPSGIESRSHQKLKSFIAEQNYAIKVPKIKRTITSSDPEKQQQQLRKIEQEIEQKAKKKAYKKEKVKQRDRVKKSKLTSSFLQSGMTKERGGGASEPVRRVPQPGDDDEEEGYLEGGKSSTQETPGEGEEDENNDEEGGKKRKRADSEEIVRTKKSKTELDEEGEEDMNRRLLKAKEDDAQAIANAEVGEEESEETNKVSETSEADSSEAPNTEENEEEAPILARRKSKTRRVIGEEE